MILKHKTIETGRTVKVEVEVETVEEANLLHALVDRLKEVHGILSEPSGKYRYNRVMKIKFDEECFGNAAFLGGDFYGPKEAEIARILRKVADQVESGATYGVMNDINGNRCGEWELA